MKTILSLLLLCVSALPLAAAEASPDAAMIAAFEKELAALDVALADGKGTVAQFSRRGDLRIFLVKFEEAVADYEKLIELDPTQAQRHWRLGIAYYLAGEFEKSAKLFEKYYEVDNADRETGLWHFLATAGLTDIATAQVKMLHYDKDSRQPFTQLFELYSGRVNTTDFFRGLYDDGLSMKQDAMFYARLYAGIYEEVSERPEKAAKFLRMAYESPWGRKATGGPGYMWQIARILSTAKSEEPATEKPAEEKKPEAEKK